MPAYSETYLMDAMENLGEMADFAVGTMGVPLDDFWRLFIATGYAGEYGCGSPRVVVGMSGSEIAVRVGERAGLAIPERAYMTAAEHARECTRGKMGLGGFGLTCEYWCGWVMAYYQWQTAQSFKDIYRTLTMGDVQRMYPTFHEEPEERFAEAANEMRLLRGGVSRLAVQRALAGLSQSQLSRKSGVGIRAIQQYEQGVKDINRAGIDKVAALARALHCSLEDLIGEPSRCEYGVVSL